MLQQNIQSIYFKTPLIKLISILHLMSFVLLFLPALLRLVVIDFSYQISCSVATLVPTLASSDIHETNRIQYFLSLQTQGEHLFEYLEQVLDASCLSNLLRSEDFVHCSLSITWQIAFFVLLTLGERAKRCLQGKNC